MNHIPEILLSNLFLLFIWGFFEVFLRNTKSFQANRFFLLAGSALAVVLPWLPWQVRIPVHSETILTYPENPAGGMMAFDPLPVGDIVAMPSATSINLPWMIYFSAIGILVLTFLAQSARMYLWIRRRPVFRWDRYRVVELNKQWPAFSFFSTIYYPEPFEPNKKETITILEHERVHARQLHSADNILLLAIRILFFYNPAVHFLAGRLRLTHEYLADAATAGNNKVEYSQTLIRHQFLVPRLLLMHSFNNQSFLKRRLNMLMKSNTRRRATWIYLLAVPLLAGMFLLSGWSASAQDPEMGQKEVTLATDEKIKVCDEMPEFQGGDYLEFNKWVMKNLNVDMPEPEKSLTGRVVVSYLVSSNGKVRDVSLQQGFHPTFDDAVLKAVSLSPDWNPGKFKGKVVDVPLTITFEFFKRGKLDKNEPAASGSAISEHKDMKIFQAIEEQPQDVEKKVKACDEMPVFQGNRFTAFPEWVQSKLKFPEEAIKNGLTGGTVYVSFLVNKQGKMKNVKIKKGVDPLLDDVVLKIVRSSPDWTPGKYKGKVVDVPFLIPVKFELTKEDAKTGASSHLKTASPVFLIVEEMPVFQGGMIDDFRKWVQSNIIYPEAARQKNKSGTEYVTFLVDTTGRVTDPRIIRSVDPILDAEVMRVLCSAPLWTPGRQRGKLVNVSFSIPVKFVLDGSAPAREQVTVENLGQAVAERKQVFLIVEEMPAFQGGTIDDFRKWVQANIVYPPEAKTRKITGTEYVSFVVDTMGMITDLQMVRSSDPFLAAEVIRVIKSAPAWNPGKQRGRLVNVSFSIPVKFVLDSSPAKEEEVTKLIIGNKDEVENQVFLVVEKMPKFKGGNIKKFVNWAQKNVKYPALAKENSITGTVEVSFVVNTAGQVEDVTVEKSLDPALDEAAINVVKSSPAWTPGKQRDKNVNVSFKIPIKFMP
jgi:TonB family protein